MAKRKRSRGLGAGLMPDPESKRKFAIMSAKSAIEGAIEARKEALSAAKAGKCQTALSNHVYSMGEYGRYVGLYSIEPEVHAAVHAKANPFADGNYDATITIEESCIAPGKLSGLKSRRRKSRR